MSSKENKQFFYGGQAVIEGVMMRGAHKAAVAVRDPNGEIQIHEEPLNATLYRSKFTKTPFVRGLIGLWDALGLGTRALMWSANIALTSGTFYEITSNGKQGWVRFLPRWMKVEGDVENLKTGGQAPVLVLGLDDPIPVIQENRFSIKTIDKIKEGRFEIKAFKVEEEMGEDAFSGIATTGLVIFSLAMGIGLFVGLPLAISSGAGELLDSDSTLLKNGIEEIVKVTLFVGYIYLIGQMEDVKRLFGYHGAEHKTINAYEAGAPLTPEEVQKFPIEHPRCGTAFLLNVIILSIIINSIIGRPDNFLVLILQRVLTIPIVAGIAYEWLRFTAKHINHPLIGMLIKPNLALQRLTTRQPDLKMIEVAIQALERVLVSEGIADEKAASVPAANIRPVEGLASD